MKLCHRSTGLVVPCEFVPDKSDRDTCLSVATRETCIQTTWAGNVSQRRDSAPPHLDFAAIHRFRVVLTETAASQVWKQQHVLKRRVKVTSQAMLWSKRPAVAAESLQKRRICQQHRHFMLGRTDKKCVANKTAVARHMGHELWSTECVRLSDANDLVSLHCP